MRSEDAPMANIGISVGHVNGTTASRAMTWLGLAAAVGFSVSAIFSLVLQLERGLFLVPYVAVVSTFLVLFFQAHRLPSKSILASWQVGLLLATAASVFLVGNIQGQPSSFVPEGLTLVSAVLWAGVVYGAVDGLFLNVVPVLAIYHAWPRGPGATRSGKVARGAAALAGTLVVTAAYHLGYGEFQGVAVLPVLLGNAIITATYLFSGSPLAPIVTHVVMHVAAVLHGMESTAQLPPHY